jgi:uncharacterized protein (TIGR03118 family)
MLSPVSVRTTSRTPRRAGVAVGAVGLVVAALAVPASGASATPPAHAYLQTNLVSDVPGWAQVTDPNLVNAWGLSSGAATPLWVSDNGTNVTTLYTAPTGSSVSVVPLVVKIPGGAPTGQVFNSTTSFVLPDGAPAFFLFASEAGEIAGWNPGLSPITGAVAMVKSHRSVYKGLALLPGTSSPELLAANFHTGRIDVFGATFNRMDLGPGAFMDPSLPAGYAPFNVFVTGDRVLVSYAKQDADKHDDVAGAGHGFIDAYSTGGQLMSHLVQGGRLNSPWGMTIAPAGFGKFAGDLLVGNFGDGRIHAYNQWTGQLEGTLRDAGGTPITIDGLWGLLPGNGTSAPADQVWFSAGPGGEAHGLLGLLSVAS